MLNFSQHNTVYLDMDFSVCAFISTLCIGKMRFERWVVLLMSAREQLNLSQHLAVKVGKEV